MQQNQILVISSKSFYNLSGELSKPKYCLGLKIIRQALDT